MQTPPSWLLKRLKKPFMVFPASLATMILPTMNIIYACQKLQARIQISLIFGKWLQRYPLSFLNFGCLILNLVQNDNQHFLFIYFQWITKDQITPPYSPLLSAIFNVLENCKIIGADVTTKGTQLKVLLTLEGNQKALFKPRWFV